MAKKGKEFNRENVIQTLRNHFGLNWDDRAKELNKLDNPDTYTGEQYYIEVIGNIHEYPDLLEIEEV